MSNFAKDADIVWPIPRDTALELKQDELIELLEITIPKVPEPVKKLLRSCLLYVRKHADEPCICKIGSVFVNPKCTAKEHRP